jgi:hypothetical protein
MPQILNGSLLYRASEGIIWAQMRRGAFDIYSLEGLSFSCHPTKAIKRRENSTRK